MDRQSCSNIEVETFIEGKLYASVFDKRELIVSRDINLADDDSDYRQVLARIGDGGKTPIEVEEVDDDRMASGRAERSSYKLR